MRNVVLQMMTSLNGRLDEPDAWVPDISDDLYQEIDRVYDTFDTVLVGQTTYYEMAAYWPGAETEAGDSDITKSMARKMNAYKKFVFSSAREKQPLEWNNAEQVLAHCDADIITFINDLKAQPGGDIHLAGGAYLANSITRLGLVDEYRFFVFPVVSEGETWFEQIQDKCDMDLVSVTPYQDGVVGLHYKPKHN
jgi:dihydrofolate reductase